MTYVGIDVSKATFVVAYSSAKGSETKTFKNTVKGIREFIQTISPKENHCVLEATGNYSMLLVYLLSKAGFCCQYGESSEDKELCTCHALSCQD